MSDTLRFLAADAIHGALDYPSLIEALREAFRRGAEAPVRHRHTVHAAEGGVMLLMPAWREGEAIGVKIVTAFPGNPVRGVPTVGALYVLLDGETGHPRMLLDGEALTLRRTACASALASTYLSRPESRVLVLVGTGKLAPYMAAAHCAARPIETVLVWGRRAEATRSLAEQLRAAGLPAEPANDLDAALARADIVSCATTTQDPLVTSAAVRDGTHVDLAGSYAPQMREADEALVVRAEVFVDTYAGALKEAGELVQPIERGVITRSHVRAELAELARGEHRGRASAKAVTLFKSVGTAIEDLAAAELAVHRLG